MLAGETKKEGRLQGKIGPRWDTEPRGADGARLLCRIESLSGSGAALRLSSEWTSHALKIQDVIVTEDEIVDNFKG